MTKYICECDKGKTHRCTHESDGKAPVVCCVDGDESCNWRAVEDQKPKSAALSKTNDLMLMAKTLTMTNIFSYNDIWTALSNNVIRKVFCDLLREKEDLQKCIEELEAENERLRKALDKLADEFGYGREEDALKGAGE